MPLNTARLYGPRDQSHDQARRCDGSAAELSRCLGKPGLRSMLGCAGDASASAAPAPAPGSKLGPLRCGDSAMEGVDPYCCPKPRALAMLQRQETYGGIGF
jgi:hypothetical protein